MTMTPVEMIILGYVFLIFIIVITLLFWVITDMTIELFRNLRKKEEDKEKEKYESHRRKIL